DGTWIETKETQAIYNKFTGELYAEISVADEKLVDKAIETAVETHKKISFAPDYRYTVLMNVADLLHENKEELAEIIAIEGGKPITDALVEVSRSASTFQIAADEAKK